MRNIFINNYRKKIKENVIFDSTPDIPCLITTNLQFQTWLKAGYGLKKFKQQFIIYLLFLKILFYYILTVINTMRLRKYYMSP